MPVLQNLHIQGKVDKRMERIGPPNPNAHAKDADAITMHPSTSYEEFIEGLRPKDLSDASTNLSIPINNDIPLQLELIRPLKSKETSRLPMVSYVAKPCKIQISITSYSLTKSTVVTFSVFGDLLTAIERSKRAVWKNPTMKRLRMDI